MPASLWWRWTLRDLRARWVQVLATALVLAVGVGGFAGLRGLEPWRIASAEQSLTVLRAHDLRVDLVDGSFARRGRLLRALQRLPAWRVGAAQERLVVPSQVDASSAGRTVLAPARLVGTPGPIGRETVDRVAVKGPAGDGAREPGAATLDWSFAHHFGLPARGRVRIAGLGRVRYDALGVSPQHFLIVDDAGVPGAEAGLAVVYLPLAAAQRAARRPGAVNELLVRAAPGVDVMRLERPLRRALAAVLPAASATFVRGDEEPVTRTLVRDARNDQKTYTVFAILLLAGAALAAFNLVTRVVEAQRREIGIGMALGAEPQTLALRPLALGLQIGALGALLGVPVGIGLANLIKGLLRSVLPLPVFAHTFPVGLYAQGAALALAIPLLAAALPVRRAVGVRPIDAIRSGYRAAKGAGGARWLRHLRPPGGALVQLPLRNLLRAPRRTLMTLLGLGAVMTAVVAVLGMVGSIGDAADRAQDDARSGSHGRLVVTLAGPMAADSPVVRAIERAPGVRAAEPRLTVSATVAGDGGQLPVALGFVEPHSRLWRPHTIEGELSGRGIVLAEKAARDIGASVGDVVRLHLPRRAGSSPDATRVLVAGIHANPIRSYAYMDTRRAAALGLAGLASEVTVVPLAHTSAADLQRALPRLRGVASVRPATEAADALDAAVSAYAGAIQMVVAITLGLALLVAFTSASVAADERRREYATMFAFGLPRRSALRVAMLESLATGILGTLVGIGLGVALTGWTVGSLLSATFPDLGIDATFGAASVATTLLVGVGAAALAPVLTFRRLRRMDIPSTLRVME